MFFWSRTHSHVASCVLYVLPFHRSVTMYVVLKFVIFSHIFMGSWHRGSAHASHDVECVRSWVQIPQCPLTSMRCLFCGYARLVSPLDSTFGMD